MLEASRPPSPLAGDGVGQWFDPFLAERLHQAGLPTLAALAQRINAAGARWWYPVRGLGATKAARVVDWLRAQQASTGLVIALPVRPGAPGAQARQAPSRNSVRRSSGIETFPAAPRATLEWTSTG
jgi:hypothetical protein